MYLTPTLLVLQNTQEMSRKMAKYSWISKSHHVRILHNFIPSHVTTSCTSQGAVTSPSEAAVFMYVVKARKGNLDRMNYDSYKDKMDHQQQEQDDYRVEREKEGAAARVGEHGAHGYGFGSETIAQSLMLGMAINLV